MLISLSKRTKACTAISAFAVMATVSSVASAQQETRPVPLDERVCTYNQVVMQEGDKHFLENFREQVGETGQTALQRTQDTARALYEDIQTFLQEGEGEPEMVTIDSRSKASNILGQAVYNAGNPDEQVGMVEDIIVTPRGEAVMYIISDGEVLNMGKEVPFDNTVMRYRGPDGAFYTLITQSMIDQGPRYESEIQEVEAAQGVCAKPLNTYSVERLIDADVLGPNMDEQADVEDLAFANGRAAQVLVRYDQILGLGGERAALDFGEATIVERDDELHFLLNASQVDQFEAARPDEDMDTDVSE